jgi:hypothetical protein
MQEIVLRCGSSQTEQRLALYAASYLQRQLRSDRIRLRPKRAWPELSVALPNWQNQRADINGFDRLFDKVASDGDFRLSLWARDWLEGLQAALELLNRYQRLVPLPLDYRPLPRLAEVLNARRLLTSSRTGQDSWRWLLRLNQAPSRAVELATLFCDVLSPAHDNGTRAVWASLGCLGFSRPDLLRATELATLHEQGQRQMPELALLSDARDLTFFSSESWQFLRDRGVFNTREELTARVSRMSSRALCLALATRQPPDISLMLEDILDDDERVPDSGVRRA